MTAHPHPKGQLLVLADAAKRGRMSKSTLRALLRDGMCAPGFKRLGSSRWLFFSSEFDQWLESARALQAD